MGASHHSLDTPVEGAPAWRAGKTDPPAPFHLGVLLPESSWPIARVLVPSLWWGEAISPAPQLPAVQFSRNLGDSTSEPMKNTQHSIYTIKKYADCSFTQGSDTWRDRSLTKGWLSRSRCLKRNSMALMLMQESLYVLFLCNLYHTVSSSKCPHLCTCDFFIDVYIFSNCSISWLSRVPLKKKFACLKWQLWCCKKFKKYECEW